MITVIGIDHRMVWYALNILSIKQQVSVEKEEGILDMDGSTIATESSRV